jgi:uncharacterized membrane protein
VTPQIILAYACGLLAVVSMALFGWAIWQACGTAGDDVWGERAMGAFLFGVFMYWCCVADHD